MRSDAMSQEATSSLFLRFGASRQLVLVLGGLHLGAVPCGFANDLPWPIQVLLATFVLLRGWHIIALHGSCLAARSIVLLIWDRHGRWRLLQRDGRVIDVRLEHGAYLHPKLLILPFRSQSGRRLCVLIAPDMVAGVSLRRLRTRLRCEPDRSPQRGQDGTVC